MPPFILTLAVKLLGPTLASKAGELLTSRYALPVAFLLVFFLGGLVGWYWTSLRADAAQLRAIDNALEKAQKQYEADLQIAVSAAKNERKIEVRFRDVEKKVYVSADDCNDLGAEWAGVFVESIRAAKEKPAD